MLRLLIHITCLSGLILGTESAIAVDIPPAPVRYQVELIVFRHIDQSRNTPETPAAASIFQISPLDLMLAEIPLQVPQLPSAPLGMLDDAQSNHPARLPISFHLLELEPTYPYFVPLRADTRSLSRVYERLAQVDAYEPIVHVGWVQPALDTEKARPYRFKSEILDDLGLAGTITLYKRRFLHLNVDLALKAASPPAESRFLFKTSANDNPDTHKLSETRRIRGSATHYFDSPQFGIITRIQEVHAAAAEREESS